MTESKKVQKVYTAESWIVMQGMLCGDIAVNDKAEPVLGKYEMQRDPRKYSRYSYVHEQIKGWNPDNNMCQTSNGNLYYIPFEAADLSVISKAELLSRIAKYKKVGKTENAKST